MSNPAPPPPPKKKKKKKNYFRFNQLSSFCTKSYFSIFVPVDVEFRRLQHFQTYSKDSFLQASNYIQSTVQTGPDHIQNSKHGQPAYLNKTSICILHPEILYLVVFFPPVKPTPQLVGAFFINTGDSFLFWDG